MVNQVVSYSTDSLNLNATQYRLFDNALSIMLILMNDSHLRLGEFVDVVQQGYAEVGTDGEHVLELVDGQLQQYLEGVRLRPLAAPHKPLPHLLLLPHLVTHAER